MKKPLLLLLIFLVILPSIAFANPDIILLANSIDFENAEAFLGFLDNQNYAVVHADISNFDLYKTEKQIIVLGGPDASEGIGEVVQNILPVSEQSHLRENIGAKNMYIKQNHWTEEQTVILLAGHTREDTKSVSEESQVEISERFGVPSGAEDEETFGDKRATMTIEFIGVNWNDGVDANYLKYIFYTASNTGNATFDPTVDIYLYEKVADGYSEVYSNSNIDNWTFTDFKPNNNWLDNSSLSVRLKEVDYKVVLNLREQDEPDVIATTSKLFTSSSP